ncbi:hypothetical protein [Streptomyces sp. TRM68367]|uniref:hypothetical protein n=1 Tax=Streptomyces sp. TRM68367 TaxID=2758415 RepID=UPI0021CF8964|nr:hypothetical protein [Streptomyces sp. TRM68367]
MSTSPTVRPATPPTVWPARGRCSGSAAQAEDVLRRTLQRHKDRQVIDDFMEVPDEETGAGESVFEARWKTSDAVTVRARLALAHGPDDGPEWLLVAEAEEAWDPAWPSPVAMFWPTDEDTGATGATSADAGWDHDADTGLRFGEVQHLPQDDKAVRRVLRSAGRSGWSVHVVVHEAMTTDDRGRVPLAGSLPPGLRHRVVEHRAAPQQLRVVNWALREFGVQVPRGGAVVLPGAPVPEGYDVQDFSVRAVFLDGSEPSDLIAAVTGFARLPRPLPDAAGEALTALREQWHLLTLEEELARERRLVTMYAEALEAMTKSRDLYREAAERAHEALTAYRESGEVAPAKQSPSGTQASSPFQHLTRTLERLKVTGKGRRPAAPADSAGAGSSDGERSVPSDKEPSASSDGEPSAPSDEKRTATSDD